jgi:hypothetical protein
MGGGVSLRSSAAVSVGDRAGDRLAGALAFLAVLVATFAMAAVVLIRNHAWADALAARLPFPGPTSSLAADPSLAPQLRVVGARAWDTLLADQTPVLIAEAEVVNDALVPVRRVVLEVQARTRDGQAVALATAACGTTVSHRLLKRIARDELGALQSLKPAISTEPGGRLTCQVAFAGIAPGVEEVVLRVSSVEPDPGHSPPTFRSAG